VSLLVALNTPLCEAGTRHIHYFLYCTSLLQPAGKYETPGMCRYHPKRDLRLPPRSRRELRPSGLLRVASLRNNQKEESSHPKRVFSY
jgi:hypothetical protein